MPTKICMPKRQQFDMQWDIAVLGNFRRLDEKLKLLQLGFIHFMVDFHFKCVLISHRRDYCS